MLRQPVEQFHIGSVERFTREILDVVPARALRQHGGFADLTDALLVHLEEEQIGNLADIGLIGDALIAQHMRKIPDLGDEVLSVHGKL